MCTFIIVNPYSLWSYLRAGYFLHVMTLAELALLCMVSSHLSVSFADGLDAGIAFKLMFLSFLAALPLFSQLDARSRYQNYKQLKDQLFLYGFDRRIFKPVVKSRCQRDAALAAAEELGHGDTCRAYFRTCGYRWYHLAPDFLLEAPYVLLTGSFWRTTFFRPTYVPRVDYQMIDDNRTGSDSRAAASRSSSQVSFPERG